MGDGFNVLAGRVQGRMGRVVRDDEKERRVAVHVTVGEVGRLVREHVGEVVLDLDLAPRWISRPGRVPSERMGRQAGPLLARAGTSDLAPNRGVLRDPPDRMRDRRSQSRHGCRRSGWRPSHASGLRGCCIRKAWRSPWKRAAAERTRSQSGGAPPAVGSDIVHPEMMALGVGIPDMSATDALDPIRDERIGADGSAQVGPVGPTAACDHVVYRGGRIALMVEVTVPHPVLVTAGRTHRAARAGVHRVTTAQT